ncbi:MAG TPA: tRNA (N(6)-L-threonylcarbamoyladenosine(37)-C(2))-methylthiotransferase MtaB [Bacteroidia bacterium]|jgi:threonylcarbamoyladenosine tRNA methylthiotransferase MtaB|nr:tRNA (N(6)-L-threonylcarbamoyladenosine(37)-C(2))-methylthiotransferase MtaB [Bacteroidia bacterium]
MDKAATFAIHTLGCKLNYSESSAITKKLAEEGFGKVDFKEQADIYIINTCSVTNEADKECRLIVRNVLSRSPGAFIAIIGCYAQLKPEEISKIEGVDMVLGASEKFNIANYLKDLDKKAQTEIHSCEIEQPLAFHSAYSSGDRTRSFLKVQDGCDYSCTYCTIPLARGKSRSDTIQNVVNNVEQIAEKGIKEIVLTGVNLGDFGINKPGSPEHIETFHQLVQALENTDANVRFRISSIEPNLLKNETIEWVSNSKKFVPHFHIPLQSGSDDILKKMRRRYLTDLYVDRVAKIKSLMPHCCIGVDVIVGFPGETDEHFNETYNFLNQLDISYLHVFTYSERANTLAAESREVVPKEVRKKRNRMLQILSEKKFRHFYEQNIGTERTALFETEEKDGFLHGYTDNYIRIRTEFTPALVRGTAKVFLKAINTDGTVATDILTITEPKEQVQLSATF